MCITTFAPIIIKAMPLRLTDPAISSLIKSEAKRQIEGAELIASENFTSESVMQAQGSILTNKYAEGLPKKRYYGGCEFVDEVEQLAIDRICELFGAVWANVQPHSGASANTAVYHALLSPGDKILGFDLSHGGHLTHGSPVNFSGRLYNPVFYGVEKETGVLNYDNIKEIAQKEKPKLIIAGASAYSRDIDFKKFRDIADSIGAFLMVDMAHLSGLVAAGVYPSPIPHAHVVTSTTHKTLRGPRGGIILTNDEAIAKKCNSAVFPGMQGGPFPGMQGGPLEHVIAAKAIAFGEALKPEFKIYSKQVIKNAKLMAEEFINRGYKIISGGTDNHLMLIDLRNKNITGKAAEIALGKAEITVNKNMVPFDTRSPFVTSGMRVGTPAVTTRGLVESDMEQLVAWMDEALLNHADDAVLEKIGTEVKAKMSTFPLVS